MRPARHPRAHRHGHGGHRGRAELPHRREGAVRGRDVRGVRPRGVLLQDRPRDVLDRIRPPRTRQAREARSREGVVPGRQGRSGHGEAEARGVRGRHHAGHGRRTSGARHKRRVHRGHQAGGRHRRGSPRRGRPDPRGHVHGRRGGERRQAQPHHRGTGCPPRGGGRGRAPHNDPREPPLRRQERPGGGGQGDLPRILCRGRPGPLRGREGVVPLEVRRT